MSATPTPQPTFELTPRSDGVIEVWRVDGRGTEIVCEIRATAEGFDVVIGDVDPGTEYVWKWAGQPFAVRFALKGAR